MNQSGRDILNQLRELTNIYIDDDFGKQILKSHIPDLLGICKPGSIDYKENVEVLESELVKMWNSVSMKRYGYVLHRGEDRSGRNVVQSEGLIISSSSEIKVIGRFDHSILEKVINHLLQNRNQTEMTLDNLRFRICKKDRSNATLDVYEVDLVTSHEETDVMQPTAKQFDFKLAHFPEKDNSVEVEEFNIGELPFLFAVVELIKSWDLKPLTYTGMISHTAPDRHVITSSNNQRIVIEDNTLVDLNTLALELISHIVGDFIVINRRDTEFVSRASKILTSTGLPLLRKILSDEELEFIHIRRDGRHMFIQYKSYQVMMGLSEDYDQLDKLFRSMMYLLSSCGEIDGFEP